MKTFSVSFFCYYGDSSHTTHTQHISLDAIPTMIAAYKLTRPGCVSISCRVWFPDDDFDYSRFLS